MTSPTRKWLWSIVLPLPLWALIALHFATREPGTYATGCLQLDTPYYAARIREVFDSGQMTPFFSNPCSQSADSPRIHFQLHTFVLAVVSQVAHIPPVYTMLIFQALCSILYARAAIALFEAVAGLSRKRDGVLALLFFWGGGVLCVAGIGAALLAGNPPIAALFSAFQFEPDKLGWWSLNVGRNIATQFEGYFHALFFLAIFAMIKERFKLALLCAALLVASHIVTGIELLIVLIGIAFVERWAGNRRVPTYFLLSSLGLLAIHVGYHVVFMNRFVEHRLVTMQNTEAWLLQANSFIPAYALGAAMVAWQMRRSSLASTLLGSYTNRILLVWASACFLLANHEFAFTPMQPVHFDRGYILAPLFLLGVGALQACMDKLVALRNVFLRLLGIAVLAGIFLFDNLCWFSALAIERSFLKRNNGDFYLSSDQMAVLDYLNSHAKQPRPIVVSEDLRLGYLVITYTPLQSWASHDHETPGYKQRIGEIKALTESGTIHPEWLKRPTLLILRHGSSAETSLLQNGAALVFENASYKVFSAH